MVSFMFVQRTTTQRSTAILITSQFVAHHNIRKNLPEKASFNSELIHIHFHRSYRCCCLH